MPKTSILEIHVLFVNFLKYIFREWLLFSILKNCFCSQLQDYRHYFRNFFFKSSIISAHDDSCVILWRIFRDIYFLTRQHTRNIPKIGQDSTSSLFYISLTRVILNLTLFDSRTYIVQWPLKIGLPHSNLFWYCKTPVCQGNICNGV